MNLLDEHSFLQKELTRLGRFSIEETNLLLNRLDSKLLSSGEYLLEEGEICQNFYFIKKGGFRQFLINDTGEEKTINLMLDGDWVLDYRSFTSQNPSETFIQAVEESEVYSLNVYDLHALMQFSHSFFQLGKIFQHALVKSDLTSIRVPPVNRYKQLLSDKPALLQKFQLKHIASFLEMTPETLSRARRNLCTHSL
jgi:CRP-like cAMP-binding protein